VKRSALRTIGHDPTLTAPAGTTSEWRMNRSERVFRWLAALACVIGVAVCTAPTGYAQPDEPSPDPLAADAQPAAPAAPAIPADPGSSLSTSYPDGDLILRSYDRRDPAEFFTASNEGVWFSTPLGLNCGIWDRGSFGCTGDIRGAPPGTTRIGWVNGNIVTRYDSHDPLLRFQFPPGRAEQTLPPRSYVEYNGTTCATMADTSTYCKRGPFRFLVTPTHTVLSPP
jgi:hypothetical protein